MKLYKLDIVNRRAKFVAVADAEVLREAAQILREKGSYAAADISLAGMVENESNALEQSKVIADQEEETK